MPRGAAWPYPRGTSPWGRSASQSRGLGCRLPVRTRPQAHRGRRHRRGCPAHRGVSTLAGGKVSSSGAVGGAAEGPSAATTLHVPSTKVGQPCSLSQSACSLSQSSRSAIQAKWSLCACRYVASSNCCITSRRRIARANTIPTADGATPMPSWVSAANSSRSQSRSCQSSESTSEALRLCVAEPGSEPRTKRSLSQARATGSVN